jgi:hypothetical protein
MAEPSIFPIIIACSTLFPSLIFYACCGCLKIGGNLLRLFGYPGSAQHRHCRRMESHIVSNRGENDDHESPLFPLRFLLNGAANKHQ